MIAVASYYSSQCLKNDSLQIITIIFYFSFCFIFSSTAAIIQL